MVIQLAVARGPDNANKLLDDTFNQIMEISGREQLVSHARLNSYLAMNSARKVALSKEGFAMVTLVLNGCNPTKPRKITRQAFVNYYLGREFQMPIDVSAIAHLADQSRLADHSVDDLFKQIRGEVKTDEVFQRSFNVDPKITAGIAGFAQKMFGRQPAPPPTGNSNIGVANNQGEGLGGLLGFFNAPANQGTQPQQSQPNQRIPSQPVNGSFERPQQADNSAYSRHQFDFDEIRDRPPRNPKFAAQEFLRKAEASVNSTTQERPWLEENRKPETQPGNKSESPQANPVRYYGSQLAEFQESRQPYIPMNNSQRFADDLDHSKPQVDFSGNRSFNPAMIGNTSKQLKALDESSFLNYQEVKPSESFIHHAEEIKAKMDPNVRNNLKRFEYDF